MARTSGKALLVPGLLLVLSALLLSSHLDAPFDKNHIGFTGAWYSLSARNLLAYGPARLDWALSIESGPPAAHPRLYLDHPPMVGFLLAGVFSLFGEGPLQARATGLALSLLAALFFYLYARSFLWDSPWLALFGVLLAVSTPIWSFYGTLVDPHGPGLLLSMAGGAWAAGRWRRRGRAPDLLAACFFVALGCLFDWAALVIALPLGLWTFYRGGSRGRKGALVLWGTWAAVFGLLLLQVHLAGRGSGGGLWAPLAKRSSFFGGTLTLHGKTLSLGEVFFQVARWNWKGIPLPLSLLGWAGAFLALRDAWRKQAPWEALLLWIPLLLGACISLFFVEAAFEHDYLQIYFAPGLGLGTAYLAGRILRAFPSKAALVRLSCLALLVFSLLWGGYRSRRRWALVEPGLDRFEKAGQVLRAKVPYKAYLLCETPFLPPLAFYSRRRIFWNVLGPAGLPPSPDPDGLRFGGILVKGGEGSGFLRDLAARKELRGPFPLAGGELDLYLPAGGGKEERGGNREGEGRGEKGGKP